LAEEIRDLHPDLKQRCREGIKLLLTEPRSGKPLREPLAGHRSQRLKRHRLIYRLDADALVIVAFGPRRIYEETEKRAGE